MSKENKRGLEMALPFLIAHLDVDDELLFETFHSFSPDIINNIKVSF